MIELGDFEERWWSGFPVRRVLGMVGLVVGLFAVAFLASWLNSRRYFLVVGPDEVRAERGVWLPIGRRPLVPEQAELAPAYVRAPLPDGFPTALDVTTFTERVHLDQALAEVLFDAAEFGLDASDLNPGPRDLEGAARLLDQLEHLPGLTAHQRAKLDRLGRLSDYYEARSLIGAAREEIEAARFRLAGASRELPTEATMWLRRASGALAALDGLAASREPEPTPPATSGSDGPSRPPAREERDTVEPGATRTASVSERRPTPARVGEGESTLSPTSTDADAAPLPL